MYRCRILLSAFKNDSTYESFREKRLSPRRAPRRSLLPLSPKRTQVRLKSLLWRVWLTPDLIEPTGGLRCKSTVCGLNGFLPRLSRSRGTFHLNPRPRSALLLLRPLSVGRKAIASLSAEKYVTAYFSARKRTSKYSRSCSQSLAQLLRLRKTRPLWFYCAVHRGTPHLAGRQGVHRPCPNAHFRHLHLYWCTITHPATQTQVRPLSG
jgi:hypothetical protein